MSLNMVDNGAKNKFSTEEMQNEEDMKELPLI